MSNYLTRLATRAFSPAQAVQPRLAKRFEPLTGTGNLPVSEILSLQREAALSTVISVEESLQTESILNNVPLTNESAVTDKLARAVDPLAAPLETGGQVMPPTPATVSTNLSLSSPSAVSDHPSPADLKAPSLTALPHLSLPVPELSPPALAGLAQATQHFSTNLRPDTDVEPFVTVPNSVSAAPEVVAAIGENLSKGVLEIPARVRNAIAQPKPLPTEIAPSTNESLLKTSANPISLAIATSTVSRQLHSGGQLEVSNRLFREGLLPQAMRADPAERSALDSHHALIHQIEIASAMSPASGGSQLEMPPFPVAAHFNLFDLLDEPSPALAAVGTQVQHSAKLTNAIALGELAQAESSTGTTPQQVNVSIGRIEVRMTPPPRQLNQSHRRISQPSVTSLSDYLRQGGQQ